MEKVRGRIAEQGFDECYTLVQFTLCNSSVVNGRAESVRGSEFLLRCRIATSISSEIIGMFDSQLRYGKISSEDLFAC